LAIANGSQKPAPGGSRNSRRTEMSVILGALRGFASRHLGVKIREIMANDTNKKESKFTAAQAFPAATLVDYQPGSIVSREILNKSTGKVTLFAFDADEGLSEHTSPYDALVQVLEGEVEITIAGNRHRVAAGELILMPANQPHALRALKRFKMILTMIRS
jgi:quercetin dioxygenase-like cupin family protein